MGRSLTCAVVVMAVCGAVAGCGGSGARLAQFSDAQIAFSYPAPWRAQYAESGLSLEESIIVTLSTLHLRSPSRRLSTNSGESGIDLMLRRLPPGAVFVAWTVGGSQVLPNYPAEKPGDWTSIGGRRAKLSFDPPAWACGWLRPTQAITAYIVGQVEMTACARDNKAFKAEVMAMLKSVKFKTPRPYGIGS